MARIKGATMTRKRRNKVLKLAKGYYGSKHSLFKTAKQAVMKSGQYAYIGRKQKKRDFRSLWITRISAAAKLNGIWLQSKVGFFFYVRAGISMAPSDAGGLDAVQNRTLPHYTEWCIEVRPYCLTNWN